MPVSGMSLDTLTWIFWDPLQAFSEYQIQQMTANFVDQFGFNDEEFADQDDNIK